MEDLATEGKSTQGIHGKIKKIVQTNAVNHADTNADLVQTILDIKGDLVNIKHSLADVNNKLDLFEKQMKETIIQTVKDTFESQFKQFEMNSKQPVVNVVSRTRDISNKHIINDEPSNVDTTTVNNTSNVILIGAERVGSTNVTGNSNPADNKKPNKAPDVCEHKNEEKETEKTEHKEKEKELTEKEKEKRFEMMNDNFDWNDPQTTYNNCQSVTINHGIKGGAARWYSLPQMYRITRINQQSMQSFTTFPMQIETLVEGHDKIFFVEKDGDCVKWWNKNDMTTDSDPQSKIIACTQHETKTESDKDKDKDKDKLSIALFTTKNRCTLLWNCDGMIKYCRVHDINDKLRLTRKAKTMACINNVSQIFQIFPVLKEKSSVKIKMIWRDKDCNIQETGLTSKANWDKQETIKIKSNKLTPIHVTREFERVLYMGYDVFNEYFIGETIGKESKYISNVVMGNKHPHKIDANACFQ